MPFYCKLILTRYRPPVVIEIKYQDEIGPDLIMFGSFSSEEPSQNKCDVYKKGRPTMIVVYPNNDTQAKSFGEDEAFNMNFFSD
jgi:hypothetical protein